MTVRYTIKKTEQFRCTLNRSVFRWRRIAKAAGHLSTNFSLILFITSSETPQALK